MGLDLYTSLSGDVTVSSVCSIALSVHSSFAFKAKSILINETHLEVYCNVINYGRVSNKLCQNVILIRLFV